MAEYICPVEDVTDNYQPSPNISDEFSIISAPQYSDTLSSNRHSAGSDDNDSEAMNPSNVREDVAIIGFSFRFPQEACDEESFWEMLVQKRSAMTEIPKDRWNVDAFYHPDKDRKETVPLRGAHFLAENPELFDAAFFSITAKEASAMDPQQRNLLETTYTALENAGVTMEAVSGSKTAVFVGCFNDDYKSIANRDPDQYATYSATGLSQAMLANRISWFYNLTGTSVQLDSACSSSMIALDLAVKNLQNEDSDMALVGGTNSILSAHSFLSLSNMNFLSPDGISYPFDVRANGYSKGEGHCVAVLKRVSDALRDGDTIRAVIRATGSNQDGRTPGITQPSEAAQKSLIHETYHKAGLETINTQYVEAHGTGTAIGDPIEANAIRDCFGSEDSEVPVYIGALKSNIGHLEGASGLAGVIKTVLVLERGVIPPNANFHTLNPQIDFSLSNVKIPEKVVLWPTRGQRRASVNCFGFGGANSHVILDDSYHYLQTRGLQGFHCTSHEDKELVTASAQPILEPQLVFPRSQRHSNHKSSNSSLPRIFVFSAADENGLSRMAAAYQNYFRSITTQGKDIDRFLTSLAYTLSARRTRLPWKSFVLGTDMELLHQMQISGPVRSKVRPRLGFVFTGQGAQYAGMAKGLLWHPVILRSFQESQAFLEDLGCEWSAMNEMLKDRENSQIGLPEYSQTICTILQVALIDFLKCFGASPRTVCGHSSGEIAAAYCVGAISHRSAIKIAYFRGKMASELAARKGVRGAMMAVGLSEGEVRSFLPSDGTVCIACINSPMSVTLSGDEEEVSQIQATLESAGIFARKLQVNVAYHSYHMERLAESYLKAIKDIDAGSPSNIDMISSVTGHLILKEELVRPEYWVRNMVSPVRFTDAISKMATGFSTEEQKKITEAIDDIVEIGSHSTLKKPIEESLNSTQFGYYMCLARGKPDIQTLYTSIGQLYCRGHPVNISELNRVGDDIEDHPPTLAKAPSYTFNHAQRYWHESRQSKEGHRLRILPSHDLLGTPDPNWNSQEARWRHFIRVSKLPWVEDHVINGTAIYPASGMMAMAIEGTRALCKQTPDGYHLQDVTFHKPIKIRQGEDGVEAQLFLRSLGDSSYKSKSWSEFRVFTWDNEDWVEHCRGNIRPEFGTGAKDSHRTREKEARLASYNSELKYMTDRCIRALSPDVVYDNLASCGYQYGPTFQALQGIAGSTSMESIAKISVHNWNNQDGTKYVQPHVVHPTTLDAAAQLMIVASTRTALDKIPTAIPTRVSKLWVSGTGLNHSDTGTVLAYAKVLRAGQRHCTCKTVLLDSDMKTVLLDMDIETTKVAAQLEAIDAQSSDQLCYTLTTRPDISLMTKDQLCKVLNSVRPPREPPLEFLRQLECAEIYLMEDALSSIDQTRMASAEPHLYSYLQWMRNRVEEASLKYREPASKSKLYSAVEQHDARGRLSIAIGRQLPGILEGAIDPLQTMFGGDLAKEYYELTNRNVLCKEPMVHMLQLLAYKNPKMRILEIGAGTGGATSTILQSLTDSSGNFLFRSYDYTDVSPVFFASAMERFKMYGNRIQFRSLDIEGEIEPQGFEKGKYDIVLAGAVLHATKQLDKTLLNARSLLREGGKLILYEMVEHLEREQFIFGLLPGWWLAEDDFRSDGPCTNAATWDRALTRTGFSGIDIEIPDYLDPEAHELSIIISTAVHDSKTSVRFPKLVIVIAEESVMYHSFARGLQSFITGNGYESCVITPLREVTTETISTEDHCIFLTDFDRPFLVNMNANSFQALRQLCTTVTSLLWISNGLSASTNPLLEMNTGFCRVIHSEISRLHLTLLTLESGKADRGSCYTNILQLLEKTIRPEGTVQESEYAEKDGLVHIRRLINDEALTSDVNGDHKSARTQTQPYKIEPPLIMNIGNPGLLDSLEFIEDDSYCTPVSATDIEIEIKATGLNFRDCLTALGQIEFQTLGGEGAGVITRLGKDVPLEYKIGDRVVVCGPPTFRSYLRSSPENVVKIPDSLSYAEAASIPINFVTAYYCLRKIACLQPGERILIHLGAGGTGQAAIQIAQQVGAIVYTTVGSESKKRFLVETYGISEQHIFHSRDTTFADAIMRVTDGQGVDVVLNSLSGDALIASWDCVAKFGRFVEIGKKDVHDRSRLPMFNFDKNISFTSFDLIVLNQRPHIVTACLREIYAMLEEGSLHKVMPLTVHGIGEVETAFRNLQSGNSMGKMAIEMRPNDIIKTRLPRNNIVALDADASYLIAGGLGGLGRSIARWMVDRGARNLILLSRKGAKSGDAIELVEELRNKGVNVEAPVCDITSVESLLSVLDDCAKTMPPVRGCVQSTMVLKDSVFENMTFEDWNTCISPKVVGSWNLHSLLPTNLDFFLFLSSISGILGFPSQANYAAANTYIDALAHHRVANGQSASTLDLGWMANEGVIAGNDFLEKRFKNMGLAIPISSEEFHSLLDIHCGKANATSQTIVGIDTPLRMRAKGASVPVRMNDPMFCHLQDEPVNDSQKDSSMAHSIASQLRAAENPSECAAIITRRLVEKVCSAICISEADVDIDMPLHEYGVDSLLAIELRNWAMKECGAEITVFELMDDSSFKENGTKIACKSKFCSHLVE